MDFNCKIDIFPKVNLNADNYFKCIKCLFLRMRCFEAFQDCLVLYCVFGLPLILEQHRSIYMHFVFVFFLPNKYSKYIFLTFIFSSFIVTIQYIIHIQNVLIDYLLSLRLPFSSSLLVVQFLGSQNLHADFQLHGNLCSQPLHCSGVNYMECS